MSPRFPLIGRAGPLRLLTGLVTALTAAGGALAAPVISELMFHPASVPEDTRREWLEISNSPGSGSVDLSGWRLSRGVSLTFPAGTVLAPGASLIVAADVAAFKAEYPAYTGTVVGGWTGRLSNAGENVRLDDAAGVRMDEIVYADDGDWALRGRPARDIYGLQAWAWDSPADGGGATLERKRLDVAGDFGQNWRFSGAGGGTPGTVPAPVPMVGIRHVRHFPPIPRPADSVTVEAQVEDAPDGGLPPAQTLFWRVDGAPAFTAVPMTAVWRENLRTTAQGTIPPLAAGTIVEYYVQATGDLGETASWPAPVRLTDPGVEPAVHAQAANALYQVDTAAGLAPVWSPGDRPVYRLVMTAAERAGLRAIQTSGSLARSDAELNATFISVDGSGTEVKHLISVRNRGFSSRTGPPNNFHLGFRHDDLWRGRESMQMNCRYPHSQVLAANFFELAGLPVQRARPARLFINNIDQAEPGPRMHGTFARVESLNGDWISNHYPGDPDGNLYRLDDHSPGAGVPGDLGSGEFRYEGTNPLAYADTFEKQSNQGENDWSDLINLTRVVSAPVNGGTEAQPAISDADYPARVREVINVEEWFTYLAMDALVGNQEGGLPTGRADDFSLYRGVLDPRFVLIPHDFDTCFDLNTSDGPGTPVARSIWSFDLEGGGVAGLRRMFSHPDLVPVYYQQMLRLVNTVWTPERLNPLVDELLQPWVAPSTVNAVKAYIAARRANVLSQIPQTYSLTTTLLPGAGGYWESPDGAVRLSGSFNVAETRSLRINGQPATLNHRAAGSGAAGTWTFSATAASGFLSRGLTHVTARFYDGLNGTGNIVHQEELDIYYAGPEGLPMTPVAGTLSGAAVPEAVSLTVAPVYRPGLPVLVRVDAFAAGGALERSAWNRTATLTASNGVVLSPSMVTLYNGMGSALVTAGSTAAGGEGTPLIAAGGTLQSPHPDAPLWRIQDNGVFPGSDWKDPGHDDSAWRQGPLEAGVGDGDERTVVAAPTASRRAFYLRHAFNHDGSLPAGLKIRAVVDDGAIFYLNGTEVYRDNMPAGAVSIATAASSSRTEAAESQIRLYDISAFAGLLRPGANLLAVEVHNASSTSDLSFDCALEAFSASADPGGFTITAKVDGVTASQTLASLGAQAPQEVSGALPASSVVWDGLIRVTGDVTVPAGGTLTIAPGTVVLLDGNGTPGSSTGVDLIVNGSLMVNGTAAQPVTLTCSDASARWGELVFVNAAPSVLRHAHITRGGRSPGRGHTGKGPLLRIATGAVTLEDCALGDSPAKAIYTAGVTDLTLRRCLLARAITGPEMGDGISLLMEDSNIQEILPDYRESDDPAPDDEDCLYVHNSSGRPIMVRRSVLARCGDDVFDCLGGPITVEDSILREGWDKGMSLLNNDLTLTRTLIVDCDKAIVPKSNSATVRRVVVDHATIICQDHDTSLSPWGYGVPPSNPDPDTPSTGLYTQNKSGQSHAGATLSVQARNSIIRAKEPIKIDSPYDPANTVVTHSILLDDDTSNAPLWPGIGNMDADPKFENASGNRLTPLSTSPARDAGDPASPLDSDGTRTDIGALPAMTAPASPGELRWTLENSPYLLTGNVTVPAGVTLRIDPGVSVFAQRNRRLTVRGGRLIAAGTPDRRITFSSVPGSLADGDADPVKNGIQTGPPKWGGVRIYDSMAEENVVAWADFIDAQGTSPAGEENYGSLGFIRSWGLVEHCTWTGTHLRMCYGRNAKLTVRRNTFPDMFVFDPVLNRIENPTDFPASADNNQEPLKVEYPTTDPEVTGGAGFTNGQPRNGWWRVYHNHFHGNRGHNDVFDADSGRWGQPGQFVLDCRYNHFHGLSGDEHIDLGGDAYIASNHFERATKDEWTSDTGYSNAISSGDKGTGTTIMVARNVFTDLDHAINLKANTGTLFEHNTVARLRPDYDYSGTTLGGAPFTQGVKCAPINVFIPEDGADPTLGDGGWIGWNLFSEVPRVVSGADSRKSGGQVVHTVTTKLEFGPNLFHALGTAELGANHPGGVFAPAHSGNRPGEPRFTDPENGDFTLLPGSDARGTGPGGLDYGATIPEWAYIIGGPKGVTSARTASFTIGGPGIVAYRWKLDNGAWSEPVTIGAGGVFPRSGATVRQAVLNLTALADGPHTLQVLGQDMAGNWQDQDPAVESGPQAAPTVRAWTVDTSFAEVVLNEILADSALGAPDSIELMNRGPNNVSVAGWRLTDEAAKPGYVIPVGTAIPAGGWLNLTSLTTLIGLDRDGDRALLFDAAGTLVDSITFGRQLPDRTLSRFGESWTLGMPTLGAANMAVTLGDPAGVRISEWFASSGGLFEDDWVELVNPSALPVSLSGLGLTDNTVPGSPAHLLPPYSYIAGNGHAAFIADGDPEKGGGHLAFSLDSEQEALALWGLDGAVQDVVLLGPSTRDVSQSRNPAGLPLWSSLPTPGFDLPESSPARQNALNILRGLRLTEIMYHPNGGNDYEYLELTNTGGVALDITGLVFTEGIQFTFPAMILPPGAQVLVVSDAAAFARRYGAGPVIAGVYSGRLDNSGETLALSLPPPFNARIFSFHYTPAWQPLTQGLGRSLELRAALPDLEDWNAWRVSATDNGSPGAESAAVPATLQGWLEYYGLTTGDLTLDSDGDGLTNLTEFALGTHPLDNSPGNGADMAPSLSLESGGRMGIRFQVPVTAQAGGYGSEGIHYGVEISGDLATWSPIATKAPDSAAWSTPGNPAAAVVAGDPVFNRRTVTVIPGDTSAATARLYLRLKVERR